MTEITIDLAAYRRNLITLADRIAPAHLMAMVKADAYGHGLLPMAREAVTSGVRLLGVLDGASGLALRAAGVDRTIRLFAWLFDVDEDFRPLIDAEVELGISHLFELENIAGSGAARAAVVHLKLDTGLHRNGASESDWPSLVCHAVKLRDAGKVVLGGVWTHIGEASDDEDSAAILRFRKGIAVAEALGAAFDLRHLAASAAGSARADARFDAVRIGAFTYGIAPGSGIGPNEIGIEPVLTFAAEVVDIIEESGGRRARVSTGYLDGVAADAGGRASVTIRGGRHRITSVGAATLEVDITGSTGVVVGDRAVLFGPGHDGEASLAEWADALGTIGEELVVRIPHRVPRRYLPA